MPVLSLLFIWPISSLLAFDMVLYYIPFLTASLSLFQKIVKMHPIVKIIVQLLWLCSILTVEL